METCGIGMWLWWKWWWSTAAVELEDVAVDALEATTAHGLPASGRLGSSMDISVYCMYMVQL